MYSTLQKSLATICYDTLGKDANGQHADAGGSCIPHRRRLLCTYSGSNNYLIPCWFCRFAHIQRMELCIIHRYILTLRDRISQKIKYHIFTWNKYLIHRTIGLNTWWINLCWQAQRTDVCCSFSAGLHRSWEGFWSTPLCRSSPNP